MAQDPTSIMPQKQRQRRASYPPLRPLPCPRRVKAQMPGKSTKTRRRPIKDADRGFRVKDCADPLVSAAEFVLPTVHATGQRQRRCRKNATRDGARHHIGGDGTETGQPELRVTQRPAAGRGGKHYIAV